MRSLCLVVCLSVLLTPLTTVAETEYPRTIYVGAGGCKLRCGPAKWYYETEALKRGAALEIHRRVEGGWLAVRPPQESFSWIPARDVRLGDAPKIAQIVRDGAVCWVGGELSKSPLRWQVRLHLGERVELLGEQMKAAPNGGVQQYWYRIAPPSGEFRWVHESKLEHEPPGQIAVSVDKAQKKAREPRRLDDEGFPLNEHGKSTANEIAFRAKPLNNAASDGQQSSETTAPASSTAGVSRTQFVARGTRNRKRRETTQTESRSEASPIERVASRLEDTGTTDRKSFVALDVVRPFAGDIDKELSEIDIALSLMVAKPASRWRLRDLRERTERLADVGDSSQRSNVRTLLNSIDRFERWQERREALERDTSADGEDGLVENDDQRAQRSSDAEDEWLIRGGVKYDGIGIIKPVVSMFAERQRVAPPYALVDKQGNILKFLTPMPGLNLERYKLKEVGVIGRSRYLPQLDAELVTALRVVVLDRHRR